MTPNVCLHEYVCTYTYCARIVFMRAPVTRVCALCAYYLNSYSYRDINPLLSNNTSQGIFQID